MDSDEALPESSTKLTIEVNDLFDELRQENRRLLRELSFAEKCIKLLERFRSNLKSFNNNCKCDETLEYKLNFNELETTFKFIKQQFGLNSDGFRNKSVIGYNRNKSSDSSHNKGILTNRSVKVFPNRVRRRERRAKKLEVIEIQRNIIRQIDLKKSRNQSNKPISNSGEELKRDDISDENNGGSELESDSSI